MNRKIAIINYNNDRSESVKKNIDFIIQSKTSDEVVVFTKESNSEYAFERDGVKCVNVLFTEAVDNKAKAKNFVNRYFKDNYQDVKYLHVLEDGVKIDKDPTAFMNDIENMLNIYDLNMWFGTVCDNCNYVYKKYVPRMSINLDDEKYAALKLDKALFTSHANTFWTIFDLKNASDDELYYCEEFTIPMFYIIEHLAKHRNTKALNDIKYMNQYPTVQSEYMTYSQIEGYNTEVDQTQLAKEDAIFKAKNIDFHPDNNIDKVLEDLYTKLNEKITSKQI